MKTALFLSIVTLALIHPILGFQCQLQVLRCERGKSAYHTIEDYLGSRTVESPDYMQGRVPCNPDKTHIKCGRTNTYDQEVFKFHLQHDKDCDPVKSPSVGTCQPDIDCVHSRLKERVEIKVHPSNGDESLKGRKGCVMRYSWKFRTLYNMRLSRKFTHLFQIKNVGGNSSPLVTLTARKVNKGTMPVLQLDNIRKNTDASVPAKRATLVTKPWSDIRGKWLRVDVETKIEKYDEGGWLKVNMNKIDKSGKIIGNVFSYSGPAELWRENNTMSRPKWGIYRQAKHPSINAGELNDAWVYFTDFCIEKVSCPSD